MRIIIIGAGPGGYETAVVAAKKGAEVVIISDGPVGGTCLNEGCIPTKSFCRNAEVLEDLAKGSVFGVEDLSYRFDFSKVISRKEEVIGQLRKGVEGLMGGKGITLVYGKASFKDQHTVVVDGTEYEGDYIIIATGSYSASLPIPGADLPGVITSREILNIEAVPQRLCVIGAGVIGLEFASIFKSFGSEVSVVEYCKDILPRFDTDLAKRLKQSLSRRGISIDTGAQVQSITKEGDTLKVNYLKKDKEFSVEADKVLMAVGRRANVGSLNLADAGIEFTPRGIVVDSRMRTNVPHIYAVGDCVGGIMLAHVATFQGFKALASIFGEPCNIDLSIVPAAVFTNPEAATVGLTEDECKDKGMKIKCYKSFYRANGKALSMDEPDGYCKIVVSEEEDSFGKILGCHLFGAHSADIVQEAAALMTKGTTLQELREIIHAHPTLSEVFQNAAHS
ncbi:MAG: dihydrolipoyl dehydrogenase [Candidatus Cryptobacteroides sp.]